MIYRYYFDIYNPDWWQEAQSMTEYLDIDDHHQDQYGETEEAKEFYNSIKKPVF
eukprot:CAMPEP_0116886080 /NCGR_PEP_ID=MMETSP0463-20121206/19743_1 /TAXON_ID=181622 /ORGANISM="Strombidinopsis sp, Strain SopsisLIS2011" /LENGTH=53 /DNA_ID=CAMNT_0004545769 /DNA_START=335 /DNA_END=496 /DNA_ORIENTATION=+